MQYPVMDRRVMRHAAQSESENAMGFSVDDDDIKRPNASELLM